MRGTEDNHWVDLMIDKIGFALTKVDESIQKSIELWKDLTKDIYDEQPTHDTTGQPNNGKSGEEDSSQDKSVVVEVKERLIQHCAMRLNEAKESPSQHCASKIPESLIQEQGDDEVDFSEKEDDHEDTVSESSGEEDMCELTLGNSANNRHHHHNEEASTELSLKWKEYGYEQLTDDDKSWGGYPRVPLGYCYLPPVHPQHKENNALYFMNWDNRYHTSTNDDKSSKKDDESWEEETNLEKSETSYIPSGYHHRNEEETDSRDGYQLLKNDDTSSEEDDDDDSWVDEFMEWIEKRGMIMDVSYVPVVDDIDYDDDDVSDKLQGFVDVKKEEVENKMECGEVETLSPDCDWVYVTRDEGLSL